MRNQHKKLKQSDAQDSRSALDSFPQSITPSYRAWLPRLKSFDREGFVNRRILDGSLRQVEWLWEADQKRYYRATKTVFDRSVAVVLLVAALPVFAVCAAWIKFDSPGPIFYWQLRLGYLGRPFWILKFRTLHDGINQRESERNVVPLKKPAARVVTRVGKILRRFKLDELPQLYNVVRGEMSLVGPRPLPIEESLVTPRRCENRFAVVPGLTGLWQIRLTYSEAGSRKIRLDSIYAKYRSWKLDLWILYKTFAVLMRGE